MKIHRIVVGLGPRHQTGFSELAALAARLEAELLGLFVEDEELLRFASFPFAMEIGFPSAVRREVDLANIERAMRTVAAAQRQACAAAFQARPQAWSFRVARGSLAEQLIAAVIERSVVTLLLPPGSDADAEPVQVSVGGLTVPLLRKLLAGRRPVLIVPGEPGPNGTHHV